jgi:hypothetical protein
MVKPLFVFAPVIIIMVLMMIILPPLVRADGAKEPPAVIADNLLSVPASGAALSSLSTAANVGAAVEIQNTFTYPGLETFSASLINGRPEDVVGVYVRDIMALPVEQQPAGDPEYVSGEHNRLTQFVLPKDYGAVGILAHNYLSGSRFGQLRPDTEIMVVFGSGRIDRYLVSHIEQFQALDPYNPVSSFIDVTDPTQRVITSSELFRRIYTKPGQLIFQTCIEKNGESSWGRVFIIANPVETIQLTVPSIQISSRLN